MTLCPVSRIYAKPEPLACGLLLLCVVFAILLPARANGVSLCVQVKKNEANWRRVQTTPGSAMRLSFQHSLYRSRVEEVFSILPSGFQLTELRYSERRLVEFYGHERATRDDTLWVVRPKSSLLTALNLHASSEASMSLLFDYPTDLIRLAVPTDTTLRLTIVSCKDPRDG
jgi:hypothetical protein